MQDALISCTLGPSAHTRNAQLACTGSGKATRAGAVDLFLMFDVALVRHFFLCVDFL
jgi:hypothetical protein